MERVAREAREGGGAGVSAYAENTQVSVERSQAEVRGILNGQGLTKFGFIEDGLRTALHAVLEKKGGPPVSLRFVVSMPDPKEERFTALYRTPRNGRPYKIGTRSAESAHEEWAKECRRRWRCLVVMLKAKFAAVESGITTFQDEFLAHICLPTGETVGEWAGREVGPALAEGRMPNSLMLGPGGAS